MTDREKIDAAAKRVCAESCGQLGCGPCYDYLWPNPKCGCHWLAAAALDMQMPDDLRAELEDGR